MRKWRQPEPLKELQNFIILKDLGKKYVTNKSTQKSRFAKIQCRSCEKVYEGYYSYFKKMKCSCKRIQIKKVSKEWTRIRGIRNGMIKRCMNSSHKSYSNYGGNGIKVCKSWLDSSKKFYEWSIKNGYNNKLTIDRIDNKKGYFPSNCRWVTYKENNRNRKKSISVKIVKKIKRLLDKGLTSRKVAEIVGTTVYRVRHIMCKECWIDINY